MEFTQVETLIQKMSSSVSDEVRQRAFSTIITKIKCKLLDLDDLCVRSPDVSATLLYWMQDFYQTNLLEKSLWLLLEMTKRPSTLKRLRQSQGPTQFLCELREWILQGNPNSELLGYLDAALQSIIDKESICDTTIKSSQYNQTMQSTTYLNLNNKENERSILNEIDNKIEVHIKPKIQTLDYVLLPQIKLLESDEKLLFDVQVQLKFGNYQTLTSTLRDQILHVVKDFPIEILKTRFEIVDSLLSLLQNSEANVCFYAGLVLKKIINQIHKRIKLAQKQQFQNAYTHQESLKSEVKEYLLQAFPTLDTRYSESESKFKDAYIEQTINQKTIKHMIEVIAESLLKGEVKSRLPGLRITIFASILNLMQYLVQVVPEPAFSSIKQILKSLAIFFDRFDTPVKEHACLPLILIAIDLFLLLPEDQCQDLNRICYHLSQSQFSNVLSQEQSHSLLCRLASLSDTEVVIQHGRVEQIIKSIKLYWDQRSIINKEFISLNADELKDNIHLLKQLLIGIPTIDNKAFIKHYVISYLYGVTMNTDLSQAEDNLVQLMYVPNQDAQILLYSSLITSLQDNNHLKLPKLVNQKAQNVRSLCIQLLQNEKIISNLFQNSLRCLQIYQIILEILSILLQFGQAPPIVYTFTNIIASKKDASHKQSELVLNLLAQNNSKCDFQRQLVNLFSKDAKLRQQSTSILSSRTYCQQVFETSHSTPFNSEYVQSGDYLLQFLDKEGNLKYVDNTDDLIKSVILRRKTNNVVVQNESSMEQISNLEGIATSKDLEYTLRSGAVDQLCELYLQYAKDQSSFSKAFGVKPSQLRSYWQDVIGNIFQILEQDWTEQQIIVKTQQNYVNLISKIINLLSCYLIFSSGDDQIRQSLTSTNLYSQRPIAIECALHYLRSTQVSESIKFSCCRFIYASVFREYSTMFPQITCQKDSFIQLCTILDQSEPPQIQNWNLYYPLSSNAEWYVSQFVDCLSKGVQPSEQVMRAKILQVDTNQSIPQQVDWVSGLQSINIQISINQNQLDEFILSPTFLGSPSMYLLTQVAQINGQTILPKLQKQVVQMFAESIGQEQVELASLYMQLCVSNNNNMVLPGDIFTLLQQYPYHQKAAQLTIKLLHKKLIQPSPQLFHYLRTHSLSMNEFQFNFLRATLGANLMEHLEPVDKHICFGQLIQFCQSPLTRIRSLSLNHLRNHLSQFTVEQQARLSDECLNIFYSNCEAQIVYSQAIQILSEQLELESLKGSDELKQILSNRRVISHCQALFMLKRTTSLFKSSVLNLVITLLTYWTKDFTPLIYNSNILQFIGKILTPNCKKLKEFNQINETTLLIDSVSQIYVLLMKQSVTTTMQLLQSFNVIELFTQCLNTLSKMLRKGLPHADYILESCVVHACKVIQIACLMQADLVCVDLKGTKHPIFTSLITLLQNEGFAGSTKTQIAFTLTCIVYTGYNDLVQSNSELIYSLNQVFNESNDSDKFLVVQSLAAIISNLNFAKVAVLQTGLPETIAYMISKELDTYIYPSEGSQSKTLKKANKSMTQSFVNTQGYNNNQCILIGVLFLKLLFAKADDESSIIPKTIAPTIGITIQILHKLLLLSSKHQLAMDHYKQILINLSTNPKIQVVLVQKITENKQQIIHDLTKYIKTDTITPEIFDSCIKCLSVLGQNSEFRLIFCRLKIIEEMSEKLYKIWEKKRTWQPTNQIAQSITCFLASVSFHKDSQPKILHSSKIMTLFVDLLRDHGPQPLICQDILLILLNCAIKLKSPFINQEGLPGLVLFYISEDKVSPETKLQASQLLINLLYKSTQSISLFNRIEVIEELETVMKQAQRQADRYDLTQGTLISEKEKLAQLRKTFQDFTNNINQIIKILRIEW